MDTIILNKDTNKSTFKTKTTSLQDNRVFVVVGNRGVTELDKVNSVNEISEALVHKISNRIYHPTVPKVPNTFENFESESNDLVKEFEVKNVNIYHKSSLINSKIIDITKATISMKCLIDSDEGIFEIRQFPKEIMSHIPNLTVGKKLILKISFQPGSYLFEIKNGDNFPFNRMEELENEENLELLKAYEQLEKIKIEPLKSESNFS